MFIVKIKIPIYEMMMMMMSNRMKIYKGHHPTLTFIFIFCCGNESSSFRMYFNDILFFFIFLKFFLMIKFWFFITFIHVFLSLFVCLSIKSMNRILFIKVDTKTTSTSANNSSKYYVPNICMSRSICKMVLFKWCHLFFCPNRWIYTV